MLSFFTWVIAPTLGAFAFGFVLFRYFAHVRHMKAPYLGPLDQLDRTQRVTISGEVRALGPLIPSPVQASEDVIAWSLRARGGGDPTLRRERWAPFAVVREDGSEVHIQRLLDFDPRHSRLEDISESLMSEEDVRHLHRQMQASVVQGKQIISWIVPSDPEYIPSDEDYEQPWKGWPTHRYGLTEIRPGESVTIVGELELIDPGHGAPRTYFCSPDYIYPFAYERARSPFHGQGVLVLYLSMLLALIPFITLVLLWSLR